MKNIILFIVIIICSMNSLSAPRPVFRHHPSRIHPVNRHRLIHEKHIIHDHHCHPSWLIEFGTGALIGSVFARNYQQPIVQQNIIQTPIIQTPIVQTQPVVIEEQPPVVLVQKTKVWVEGCYVDQVQPNGLTVKVWQPGHWEYR